MKILQISKYPPIQGGVSAECFWLAQALSEIGHSVTVLTNADEVEPEYRLEWSQIDKDFVERQHGSRSVLVASTTCDPNHYYIPKGMPAVSKLVSKGLELIENSKPDIIYSSYLEPYGVSAAFLSAVTGIPHVVTHAGSDVGRPMKTPGLSKCYEMVLQTACAVVTNRGDKLGIPPEKRIPTQSIRIRPELFYPTLCPARKTVILGIYGKIGKQKGTSELLLAVSRLVSKGAKIELRCLWGGKGIDNVTQIINSLKTESFVKVSPFIPHWRIPDFIRECDAILFLENSFPIREHYPLVPLEAIACGRPVLMNEEIAMKGIYTRLQGSGCLHVIAAPFTTDSLELGITALIERLPSLKRSALTAFDSFIENEISTWRMAERFDKIFELSSCSKPSR